MAPASTTTPTTEFATSADGTRIAFERTGAGPVIVLVDGAMCYREFGPARDVAKTLTDRYSVIVYDRRGRGESGNTEPYAPEREFEDLGAVIQAAGGDAFVMGQSSGAGIAYRAAASGVPMRKLIGYEAPWVGLNPNKDGSPRDYIGELDGFIAKGENGKAVDYFMVKMVKGPWFLPLMMRTMRKVWGQLQTVAPTLRYDARVMGVTFTAPADELARIDIPTLVLCGSKAAAEMTRAQDEIAATIPGARRETLAGQTHNVAPSALLPHFREFFV